MTNPSPRSAAGPSDGAAAGPGREGRLSPFDSAMEQYRAILAMIVDQRLPPGTLLLETALAKQLGVSRNPVREALARLAQQGIIVRDIRGYVVKTRTPEEILEIYDIRILLESSCAGAAASKATAYDLARLEHLTQVGRTSEDLEERVRMNAEWHVALRAAAHNTTASRLLDELGVLQQIYNPQMQSPSFPMEEAQEDHERILAAIRNGDAETAQEEMTRHLRVAQEQRVAEFLRHYRGEDPR